MKPVLIYSRSEASRNSFVVDLLKNELGVKLVEPSYNGTAPFVINRTNDYKIAQKFEKQGIRVFNPSKFSRLANDKQFCYDFMQKNGIAIMPTRYKNVPFVKKPIDGHGGAGVVMCQNISEYDENCVCQKPASDLGKDLRVWVVGNQIITSILRVNKNDFRSNYCLGGDAIPYNLSSEETALINKIIALVNGDYYGIDFVFDGGKIVFNELEDTVGARMVYDKTDIDILKIYCEHIKKTVRNF
jgi:ribosomal protein S6--L-glutamate ligase/gamma-F420-2:alpha-L-glutamate ligase